MTTAASWRSSLFSKPADGARFSMVSRAVACIHSVIVSQDPLVV